MTKFYVEPPASSMAVLAASMDVKTPLIFVLSAGADPTAFLTKYAKDVGYEEKLTVISLG